jgi:hypothetical protein
MENTFEQVEELAHTLKSYVNTRFEGAKLTVIEKVSEAASDVTARILAGLVWFLFLIFLGISLAYFLNEWWGSVGWSFLCIAVFYLLVGILLLRLRVRLFQLPMMNKMIQKLHQENEED